MNWLSFAVLAQLVYTAVVFIDKYIVSKEVKNYQAMPIFTAFIGFLAGFTFWIILGFPRLVMHDALIVLATGILTVWGLYFYFKALSWDDSSTVIILMQMIPMFVLIFAFLLLTERLTAFQLIGFAIILFSTSALSLERTTVKLHLGTTFIVMMMVDLFWAGAAVLMKFAIEANTFDKILPYESWGIGIGGALIYMVFPSVRQSFAKTIRCVRMRALGMMVVNEILFVLAKSLTFFAYFLGPVTLVSIISSTQILFGILFGIFLTLIFPKFFREDITGRTLLKKSAFAAVTLMGIVLIS